MSEFPKPPQFSGQSGEKGHDRLKEIIEMIMQKIEDINMKGIAYTGLDINREEMVTVETLRNVLEQGLIGHYKTTQGTFPNYFNIIGSGCDWKGTKIEGMEIKNSFWAREAKVGTFLLFDPRGVSYEPWHDDFLPLVDTEDGFVTQNKIHSDAFRGLVIKSSDESETISKVVQSYAETIIDAFETNGVAIPIYDIEGNLLWPKQIRYEDIKSS